MTVGLAFERHDVSLYLGECVATMRELPEETVDAIVTDPPYDLTAVSRNGSPRINDPATPYGRTRLGGDRGGFMGKTWDGTGVAFDPETWRAVLRLLKPGGHLVAFGGTRTYHRLTCAIEDAGFEIRDCINWLYGQGFPKSLDVGKAIDKAAGATREVVGRAKGAGSSNTESLGVFRPEYYYAPSPATDAAREWDGWGTALKPAWEPIVLARKPLGTGDIDVRRNVEREI